MELRLRPRRLSDGQEALIDHWRRWAACLTEDPELFFLTGATGVALEEI